MKKPKVPKLKTRLELMGEVRKVPVKRPQTFQPKTKYSRKGKNHHGNDT